MKNGSEEYTQCIVGLRHLFMLKGYLSGWIEVIVNVNQKPGYRQKVRRDIITSTELNNVIIILMISFLGIIVVV